MTDNQTRSYFRDEAARFLTEEGFPIAPTTLAKLASLGGGPPFTYWGRKPRYPEVPLLDWAKSRCSKLKASTSDKR